MPAALAGELHARAGGNPFFVEELFAARDALPATRHRGGAGARRAARRGLRSTLLAAAGGHASHALLERLEVAPDALRAALDAGVLVREPDGVAFRHGLIGEVALRAAAAGRAHARCTARSPPRWTDAPAAQRALPVPPRRAARGGAGGVGAGRAGGRATCTPTPRRACTSSARSSCGTSVDRVDLLARAAQAARFAGDPERAVALCREAIALTDEPARKALLYERLGEFHFWDDEAALECYERALALLPGEPRLLAAEGHALMGLRRWDEARACCEAALDAGAGPRITLGSCSPILGEPEAGEAHLRRALELAANGEETARAYLHLGELLRVRGDHAGALAAMVDGEREAARLGLRGSFGHFMYVNAADDLLRLGRWDEAAERLAEAARMDLSRTAAALRRAIAGQLHALRGDLEAARAELDAAGDDGLPSEFLAPLGGARATLALRRGRPRGRARARRRRARPASRTRSTRRRCTRSRCARRPSAAEQARARRRAPDPARADALLAGLDALLERARRRTRSPHLALARAEHARVDGRPGAAAAGATAAAAFDALAEPYPAAYARLREAEAIAARGRRARAPALRALAAAHDDRGRARRAPAARGGGGARPARAARPRRRAAAPPRRDDDGVGLTAREVEVLRLLADGLTNREIAERLFISQKTVAAHMAHIYDKLDVHSRVEAAGRAQQLGVLERPS